MSIITLLTDFGWADGYVAAMKGVILAQAPDARLIDAGHDVPAHDVQAGAWALHQYWRSYSEGTIHVAVVDPGVGTDRRALLVAAEGRYFLAPDNGLLSWVLQSTSHFKMFALQSRVHRPGDISATFHGRDVFAYAAGRLAAGHAVKDLAEPIHEILLPTWATVNVSASVIRGAVIHVDRFGNLITNITRWHLEQAGWPQFVIRMGATVIDRLSRTYGDAHPGMALALIGSSGHLEISVREGSAKERMGGQRGESVLVELQPVA